MYQSVDKTTVRTNWKHSDFDWLCPKISPNTTVVITNMSTISMLALPCSSDTQAMKEKKRKRKRKTLYLTYLSVSRHNIILLHIKSGWDMEQIKQHSKIIPWSSFPYQQCCLKFNLLNSSEALSLNIMRMVQLIASLWKGRISLSLSLLSHQGWCISSQHLKKRGTTVRNQHGGPCYPISKWQPYCITYTCSFWVSY